MTQKLQKATFAGGCFWCTEAIFKRVKGVRKVIPGYTGGEIKSPSYEEVSSGNTGHAEAVQLEFDPKKVNYDELLDIFFHLHDPTQLNRQGPDVGTQYRSSVFYHDDEQKSKAIEKKEELQGEFDNGIVTEIEPFKAFYEAEPYHKDFYERNKENRYCRVVIDPKIKKLMKNYKDKLKSDQAK